MHLILLLGKSIEIGLGSLPASERWCELDKSLRQQWGVPKEMCMEHHGGLLGLGTMADQHPMAPAWRPLI
jgi:hypothetical protein